MPPRTPVCPTLYLYMSLTRRESYDRNISFYHCWKIKRLRMKGVNSKFDTLVQISFPRSRSSSTYTISARTLTHDLSYPGIQFTALFSFVWLRGEKTQQFAREKASLVKSTLVNTDHKNRKPCHQQGPPTRNKVLLWKKSYKLLGSAVTTIYTLPHRRKSSMDAMRRSLHSSSFI